MGKRVSGSTMIDQRMDYQFQIVRIYIFRLIQNRQWQINYNVFQNQWNIEIIG